MSTENSLLRVLAGTFTFTARPEPVAGDLRMAWGISVLLLSLAASRGKKASFQKLQLIAHAVRIPEGRQDVTALINGQIRPADLQVRVEPWLNRAVSYAHALNLVCVDKGRVVSLTDFGIDTANKLRGLDDTLAEERDFLFFAAPKLTEALTTKVWRMEDLL